MLGLKVGIKLGRTNQKIYFRKRKSLMKFNVTKVCLLFDENKISTRNLFLLITCTNFHKGYLLFKDFSILQNQVKYCNIKSNLP